MRCIRLKTWLYTARRSRMMRCEDGITALEFAFIAPAFLLIIMGIIEFSLIMFTTTVMESATNTTSRLGKTGYDPSGVTRQQAIMNSITSRTAGLLDPAKISLSSTVYSDFNDVGQPEPCVSPATAPCPGVAGTNFVDVNGNGAWDSDMGQAGLGNAGDVVVYSVSYPWPIMSPLVVPILGSTFTITVRTVVRNEPFSSGS
jgi:Flp pilus assembly protein TadG